jgi:MFS-type transporter involved in bile tolerance (Atg22 family)
MVSPERRGVAYGIFNTAYGISWFFGTAFMGVLYELDVSYLVAFSIILELASLPLLLFVQRGNLHSY